LLLHQPLEGQIGIIGNVARSVPCSIRTVGSPRYRWVFATEGAGGSQELCRNTTHLVYVQFGRRIKCVGIEGDDVGCVFPVSCIVPAVLAWPILLGWVRPSDFTECRHKDIPANLQQGVDHGLRSTGNVAK